MNEPIKDKNGEIEFNIKIFYRKYGLDNYLKRFGYGSNSWIK